MDINDQPEANWPNIDYNSWATGQSIDPLIYGPSIIYVKSRMAASRAISGNTNG
jgi:hypothetical protein